MEAGRSEESRIFSLEWFCRRNWREISPRLDSDQEASPGPSAPRTVSMAPPGSEMSSCLRGLNKLGVLPCVKPTLECCMLHGSDVPETWARYAGSSPTFSELR